jgi:glycosyl transferase family 87
VIAAETHDPVALLATWHNWRSPYGTLFTVLTYPLAWMPLQAAYWVMKVATVAMSLAFLWLVQRCAQLMGRDPRCAGGCCW